jgi:hypothetical protein
MLLVKCYYQIKIGVDYIVVDLCVIKSGLIVFLDDSGLCQLVFEVDFWWLILGLLLFDYKG